MTNMGIHWGIRIQLVVGKSREKYIFALSISKAIATDLIILYYEPRKRITTEKR